MNQNEDKQVLKLKKAYKNLDFLNSKDARTIRILSEYLFPKAELEKNGIQNTIVIFGSARAPSPEELEKKEGTIHMSTSENYTSRPVIKDNFPLTRAAPAVSTSSASNPS